MTRNGGMSDTNSVRWIGRTSGNGAIPTTLISQNSRGVTRSSGAIRKPRMEKVTTKVPLLGVLPMEHLTMML